MARILTALAVAFIAFSAAAGSFWIQLDSHNIDRQPLTLKVKSEEMEQTVLFRVYIEPKQAALSGLVGATLTVISGKKQIVSVGVEKSNYNKGVLYEFEVSPKYLAQSKFSFKHVEVVDGQPIGDVYWFFLKEFASEK